MLNNIFIFLNYANKYQFLKKSFFLQFKDNSVGNLKCMFSFIYINLSLKLLSKRQRRDIFWLEQRVPKEQKKAKVENPRPREKASMRRVSAFVCFNQRIFFLLLHNMYYEVSPCSRRSGWNFKNLLQYLNHFHYIYEK